ncbi:MAG: hypothetical protein R2794_13400 [Chitinophagales bacterium]
MQKQIIYAFALSFFFLSGFTRLQAQNRNVEVTFTFVGIEEGYDHQNKSELYIDGQLVGTSDVKNESQPNTVSGMTTKGEHTIRIVNYAYYEGEWEAHTMDNNYSIDCVLEKTVKIKKKKTSFHAVFDIDDSPHWEK